MTVEHRPTMAEHQPTMAVRPAMMAVHPATMAVRPETTAVRPVMMVAGLPMMEAARVQAPAARPMTTASSLTVRTDLQDAVVSLKSASAFRHVQTMMTAPKTLWGVVSPVTVGSVSPEAVAWTSNRQTTLNRTYRP